LSADDVNGGHSDDAGSVLISQHVTTTAGFCCAEVSEIAHELDWFVLFNRVPTSEQLQAMVHRLFEIESRLLVLKFDDDDWE
jgi:hypothetical protein